MMIGSAGTKARIGRAAFSHPLFCLKFNAGLCARAPNHHPLTRFARFTEEGDKPKGLLQEVY